MTSQRAEEFREQGFTIVPGFFSAGKVKQIVEGIEDASQRMPSSTLTRGDMIFRSKCFRFSKELQDVATNPKIVSLLSEVIGPGFWLRWDQCVAKGPGAPEFPWHQDNAYNSLVDEHYQLWIALTEMTTKNGGILFKPGSHRWGRLPHKLVGYHRVYQGVVDDPVFIGASPGDVVLFSSRMLHSTAPNRSDSARWAYVC